MNSETMLIASDLGDEVRAAKSARVPADDPNLIRCEFLLALINEGTVRVFGYGPPDGGIIAVSRAALAQFVLNRTPNALRLAVEDAIDGYLHGRNNEAAL